MITEEREIRKRRESFVKKWPRRKPSSNWNAERRSEGTTAGKGKGKGRRARRRFCNRTLSRRWRCKETNVFMYCSILKSVVKSFTLLLPASLSLSRASWRFSWRCETEYPMWQHSDPLQFRSYLKTYFGLGLISFAWRLILTYLEACFG